MKAIKENENILVVLDSFISKDSDPFISLPVASVNGSLLSESGLDAFGWDDILVFYKAIAYQFISKGGDMGMCPDWGRKESGAYGPCSKCASCELVEFLMD